MSSSESSKSKKLSKLVKLACLLITGWLLVGYLVEYFLPLNAFKKYSGKVEMVSRDLYTCLGGGGRYSTTKCERTIIYIQGNYTTFQLSDYAYRGAALNGVEEGDTVDLYIRHSYQWLMTLGDPFKIYHLEKKGNVIYPLEQSKSTLLAIMFWPGTFFFMFSLIYFDDKISEWLYRNPNKRREKKTE